MADRLLVATPWYPAPGDPYHGVFVRESVAALGHPAADTTVLHVRSVLPGDGEPLRREDSPLGTVVRMTVELEPSTPRVEVARAHRTAIAGALATGSLPELAAADVVHAHVGMPTGWAVSRVLAPHQRLVTTEHATYLETVLRLPAGERAYGEMLGRAATHLCVSEAEARRLRVRFPEHREHVAVVANPVDEVRFAALVGPRSGLRRWLYVGNLVPRKNVGPLLRAFALAVEQGVADALVVVGDGPQRAELEALAQRLGVAPRVTFHGPAEPDDLPGLFAAADVLVHLSSYETFGLTVVEAAMAGLPVVTARSGGPQETLSDAIAQGLAELVRSTEPDDVVAAVRVLQRRQAGCDRAAVRAVLVERFGGVAYGRRLADALAGRHAEVDDDAPVVVAVATSRRAARRLVRVLAETLRVGARVVLVTTVPDDAVAADPRVHVVDLAPRLRWAPWRLVPHLVRVVPAALLRGLRKACSVVAAARGPWRSPARRGVNAVSAALGRWSTLADRIDDGLDTTVLAPLEARLLPALVRGTVTLPDGRSSGQTDARPEVRADVVVRGDASAAPLAAWLRDGLGADGCELVGPVDDPRLRDLVAAARERRGA